MRKLSVKIPQITKSIDRSALLSKLLRVLWLSCTKPQPDRSDESVVAYAIRLLSLCIASDPGIILATQTKYSRTSLASLLFISRTGRFSPYCFAEMPCNWCRFSGYLIDVSRG